MATVTDTATKAIKDCAEPARAVIHEQVRELRRTALAGRQAAEDCAAEARIQVRRNPFLALGLAIGVGTVVGCVLGFTAGELFGRRRSA